MDNYANYHIFSEEEMFTDKIESTISNVVYTIEGKYLVPKGIGAVSWSRTDDEGKPNTKKLNNVLYFPD